MRGSPLFRALMAFMVILALGFPLWRLTYAVAENPDVIPFLQESSISEISMGLEFTTPPSEFKVLHLGKEIWAETAPGPKSERKLMVPYPKDGVEFEMLIRWPEETLCAMRVRLIDPSLEEHQQSVWGKGTVSEVVKFP